MKNTILTSALISFLIGMGANTHAQNQQKQPTQLPKNFDIQQIDDFLRHPEQYRENADDLIEQAQQYVNENSKEQFLMGDLEREGKQGIVRVKTNPEVAESDLKLRHLMNGLGIGEYDPDIERATAEFIMNNYDLSDNDQKLIENALMSDSTETSVIRCIPFETARKGPQDIRWVHKALKGYEKRPHDNLGHVFVWQNQFLEMADMTYDIEEDQIVMDSDIHASNKLEEMVEGAFKNEVSADVYENKIASTMKRAKDELNEYNTFMADDSLTQEEKDALHKINVNNETWDVLKAIAPQDYQEFRGLVDGYNSTVDKIKNPIIQPTQTDTTATTQTADTTAHTDTTGIINQMLIQDPQTGLFISPALQRQKTSQKGVGRFAGKNATVDFEGAGVSAEYINTLLDLEDVIATVSAGIMTGEENTTSQNYGPESWNRTQTNLGLGIQGVMFDGQGNYGVVVRAGIDFENLKRSNGTYADKPMNSETTNTFLKAGAGIGSNSTNIMLLAGAQASNGILVPSDYLGTSEGGVETNLDFGDFQANLYLIGQSINGQKADINASGNGFRAGGQASYTKGNLNVGAGLNYEDSSFRQELWTPQGTIPLNDNPKNNTELYLIIGYEM